MKTNVIGLFCIKLFKNFYILKPHKSDKTFVSKRAEIFMNDYFGEHYKTNNEQNMINRRMGFEDGYLACLRDLKIKLTYTKNETN